MASSTRDSTPRADTTPMHTFSPMVMACTQAFLIVLLFSADAYDFAFSMCTVAIVITWAFAAAYQAKWGVQNKNMVQAAIGFVAVAFQVSPGSGDHRRWRPPGRPAAGSPPSS